MKKALSSILIIIALLLILPANCILADEIDYVDVRIGKTYAILDRVLLTSREGFELYSKDDKTKDLMTINSTRLFVSISFSDSRSLDIFDESNSYVTTIPADGSFVLGTNGETINVSGTEYRGYIGFISGSSGLMIINHVDVESYLYGVVPKEIPPLSSEEALKAQAVAARSFVYNSINKHASEGYNLCDTTHCQAYGGMASEHGNTNRAVAETFGLVATYNGLPASTVYHSSSGGYTENSEKVWVTAVPYLRAVPDPFSATGQNSSWSLILNADDLEAKLESSGFDVGRVEGLSIIERTESGRVSTMEIIGSRDTIKLTGAQFRSVIGTITLKSTLFYIGEETSTTISSVYALDSRRNYDMEPSRRGYSVIGKDGEVKQTNTITVLGSNGVKKYGYQEETVIKSDEFLITGKGFGHGVGMSQYGAIEMAKQGYTFDEILKHYYKNIELTTFYR